MTKPDKLEEIFRLQVQLNQRIGVDTTAMTDDERQTWVLNYCREKGVKKGVSPGIQE